MSIPRREFLKLMGYGMLVLTFGGIAVAGSTSRLLGRLPQAHAQAAGDIFYNIPSPGNSTGTMYQGNSLRYGEQIFSSSSSLVGKSLKRWTVNLKKQQSPSGLIHAVIRRGVDDTVVATFNELVDASTLPAASFGSYIFSLNVPHLLQLGDKVMLEYSGPPSVLIDQWNVDKIDGNATRRIRYDGVSFTYVGGNSQDITGTMSSDSSDTTPPSQVFGVTVTTLGSGELAISWTANAENDLSHYNVYRSTTPNFIPDPSKLIAEVSSNAMGDTGLSPLTTYYYRVAAVDNSGNMGPPSAEASGATSAAAAELFYDVPFPADAGAILHQGRTSRLGVEAFSANSSIIGKQLKKWSVYIKKSFTPSGPVTAVVRRRSDDAVVATFNEVLNSVALTTAYTKYVFTLPSTHVIQLGDKIMIEYSGPQQISLSRWSVDKVDGSATRRIRFDDLTSTYVGGNSHDIPGTMSNA